MPTQWRSGYAHAQSWTGVDWLPVRGALGVDPYLVWAETTNFRYLGGLPVEWVSVILEVAPSVGSFAAAVAGQPWIQLHQRYTGSFPDARFCTALVKKAFFERLHAADPVVAAVVRFELGLPIVNDYDIEDELPPPPASIPHVPDASASSVVGIIDDGFAFAHDRFRKPDGRTRIDFLWDQSYHAPSLSTPDYGREFTNGNIDGYIASATVAGCLNEDAVYRMAAYREVRRRIAHGTAVADLACGADGADPDEASVQSRRMVCVQLQLPSRKTRDRSGGWLAVRVLDALRYIVDRAEDVAAGKPVTANLSFGNIAGPHDGSAIVESAIEDLISLRTPDRLAVVFAVGNSNLSRCHGRWELAPGATETFPWRVLPDDPTPNFMEIWVHRTTAAQRLQVAVSTPSGDASGFIDVGQVLVWGAHDEAHCTIVYRDNVATGAGRMVLLAISPTVDAERARRVAPSGEWKVSIRNADTANAIEVYAWIQRDETPFNFPRHGRQSRFEDDRYVRFHPVTTPAEARAQLQAHGSVELHAQGSRMADDRNAVGFIRREGTMNALATGAQTIVVGGFRRSDGAAAVYSSSGPGVPQLPGGIPQKHGPDAAAVSDDSAVLHGVLAAGARSGSTIALDGTSVAAAALTRWAAAHQSGGGAVDRAAAAARATADEAARPTHYKPLPRPQRVGSGRLALPPLIKVLRRESDR